MQSTESQVYKFGTSGYRNDTDAGFSDAVVSHITNAIGDYLISEIERKAKLLPVLIGGDTREKSLRYIPIIAEALRARGLDVWQASTDVPSPVLAYAAKYFYEIDAKVEATLGAILMTASHNPWAYGGYNFLTPDAAVMPTSVSSQIEGFQSKPANKTLDRARFGSSEPAQVRKFDPYELYQRHLKSGIGIDYAAIKTSGLQIFYDPLYATGLRYLPRLLKDEGIDSTVIHDTQELPAGYDGMPEPTGSNLTELSELVKNAKSDNGLKIGLANDGDSDRFGVLDENGRYLNSNEVLSLVVYHLINNRKQRGAVVRSQATSHILDALAEKAGLPVVQTPVGYKYIAEEFIEHEEHPEEHGNLEVLIGGESSGGLSTIGHIPEKDGLLANLLMSELVAIEKQPLSQILKKVQASVTPQFVFRELGVKTERGKAVLAHFEELRQNGGDVAGFIVDSERSRASVDALQKKYETRDGVKLFLQDGSWLLIRASGTEPIVRVYVEGQDTDADKALEESQKLVDFINETLVTRFDVPQGNIKEKK